jgi:hypothetical protein
MGISMPKLTPGIDTERQQLSILDIVRKAEVSALHDVYNRMSIDAAIRSIISNALKHSPLSRYEVAAKMSDILGVEITKAQLDSWSSESHERHRFPFIYSGAFCRVTGCSDLARLMAKLCGGHFIEGTEILSLELGKLAEQKRALIKKEKMIRDLAASLTKGKRHV